jgi:uncharacterized protein (TIRG00374 family)
VIATAEAAAPARAGLWRRYKRMISVVFGLAVVGVGVWVVWGRREELAGASVFLEHLRYFWVVVAVVAEAVATVAFAAIQARLMAAGGVEIGLGTMTGITLAGNALANSLPGGAAVGTVFAYRQFKRRGADTALASWVLLGVTAVAAAGLALLSFAGIQIAGTEGPASGLRVVSLVVLAVGVGLVVLFRRPRVIARAAEWIVRLSQRLVRWPKGDPVELIEGARVKLKAVQPDTGDWLAAFGFSMINWLADCACLCAAFLAVGAEVPWRGLLLAYGAGQLAANLPLTPGGLGVVEGSLALALVAYGGGEESTIAAVLLYRIMSFWALLPVGWSAWGVLEWRLRRKGVPA